MKKRIRISLCLGLVCAIFLSLTSFNSLCEDLRENVLRIHIRANSNLREDQELKLKIRDEILKETQDLFADAKGLSQAESIAKDNLETFEKIANTVITNNGFDYKAHIYLGDSFFETREYDTFSLPAGNYRSLIIDLGNGEGKNWWCVIFPSICVPTATNGDLRESVNENSAEIAENANKYIVKFKTVEIYEKIRKIFN